MVQAGDPVEFDSDLTVVDAPDPAPVRWIAEILDAAVPHLLRGSLARALEDYFTGQGLALPTDQAERLN